MKFYLFRHGQTDWNKERRIQGHSNIPLNKTGQEQALKLREILSHLELDIIYSSDLDRAFETAVIGIGDADIKVEKDIRLREAHFGEAEGMLLGDIVSKFGEDTWNKFMTLDPDDLEISFPGGESRKSSIVRMRAVIDELRRDNKFERVGISTHGGVVRNLLASYLIESGKQGRFDIPIPNCVVYELDFSTGEAIVSGPIE